MTENGLKRSGLAKWGKTWLLKCIAQAERATLQEILLFEIT